MSVTYINSKNGERLGRYENVSLLPTRGDEVIVRSHRGRVVDRQLLPCSNIAFIIVDVHHG